MEFIVFVVLMLLGYFVGKLREKKHYRSIREREAATLHQPALTFDPDLLVPNQTSSKLVSGSVVVSVDYFKRFLSSFRLLFGGELKAYSPLLDRGRREALLRMKEECPDADMFINTRMETSTISSGSKDAVGTVEVIAYGTAIRIQK